MTLMDLGQEIISIRDAINSVEIKGIDQIKKNSPYLVYAFDKCNHIIQTINEIAKNQLPERQNGVEEGREADGRQD